MKGSATAMKNGDSISIYIPVKVVRMLNIKPGNLVEFEVENPFPDKIMEKRKAGNFKKKLTLDILKDMSEITTN